MQQDNTKTNPPSSYYDKYQLVNKQTRKLIGDQPIKFQPRLQQMSQYIKTIIPQKQWQFEICDSNQKTYYKKTIQADCKQLRFFKNQSTMVSSSRIEVIPISLGVPVFNNLRIMDFYRCNLSNIQAIAFINAENLYTIILQNNWITNIKPLSKTKFNSLEVINLVQNYFASFDLSRTKMKKLFHCLSLQSQSHTTLMYNMQLLIKFQPAAFKYFYIRNSERMFQQKFISAITRKHQLNHHN